eukprot:7326497-Prymnesium_polylepis.2
MPKPLRSTWNAWAHCDSMSKLRSGTLLMIDRPARAARSVRTSCIQICLSTTSVSSAIPRKAVVGEHAAQRDSAQTRRVPTRLNAPLPHSNVSETSSNPLQITMCNRLPMSFRVVPTANVASLNELHVP